MKWQFLWVFLFLMIFHGFYFINIDAYADNSLENIHLIGINEEISVDIGFLVDEIDEISKKNSSIGDVVLVIPDEEIQLLEPQLKISPSGEYFRIFSESEDILIYGYEDLNNNNYKINITLPSHDGLKKYSVLADIHYEEKEFTDDGNIEKNNSFADLKITSSHDYRTYWKETFNIDVQTFDGTINPNPKQSDFNGRIDGVDIKVLVSLNGILLSTLSGITSNHGHWEGEYYVEENISAPGEHIVDVIATYQGQTVSKSSSMFVISDTPGDSSGSPNSTVPVANAGSDYTTIIPLPGCPCMLDGSGSSDPSGDALTYSWTQKSGTPVVILDEDAESTTFTSVVQDTYVFELTVTNSNGESDTDTVIVTLTL